MRAARPPGSADSFAWVMHDGEVTDVDDAGELVTNKVCVDTAASIRHE